MKLKTFLIVVLLATNTALADSVSDSARTPTLTGVPYLNTNLPNQNSDTNLPELGDA